MARVDLPSVFIKCRLGSRVLVQKLSEAGQVLSKIRVRELPTDQILQQGRETGKDRDGK